MKRFMFFNAYLATTALLLSLGLGTPTVHAQDAEAQAGRLVIVGGALKPEHEAIYRAFLEGVDDDTPVGVVPLASGVPERSGPLSAQDIQQYAANPQRIFDTEIVHTKPEMAKSKKVARTLGGCSALWFTGGDQRRITANLRPAAGDTPAYAAVQSVLNNGGTVGGTSAGAAMMSEVMIRGGSSRDAMLLGPTDDDNGAGVAYGRGMGFFPYGVVDQHFLRRGRFGRLLVALESTDTPVGFGVSENRGMAVDRSTHQITAIGPQAITVIDRRASTRNGHTRTNLRIHLLGSGDQVKGNDLTVTIAADKQPLEPHGNDIGSSIAFPEMWDRYVVAEMIKALALNPSRPVLSDDGNFDYRMSADAQTRFYVGSGEARLSAVGVRLDITPRGDIEQRIADRKKALAERASQ